MGEFRAADHMLQLQGKDYLPVAPRVLWARREHPDWSIMTCAVEIGGAWHMQATVMDGTRVLATAHKRVREQGRGPAAQFPVETAETGAIGRALGLCGYGTLAGDLDEGDELADAPVARLSDDAAQIRQIDGDGAKPLSADYTERIGDTECTGDALALVPEIAGQLVGEARRVALTQALARALELAKDRADLGQAADAIRAHNAALGKTAVSELRRCYQRAEGFVAEAEAKEVGGD